MTVDLSQAKAGMGIAYRNGEVDIIKSCVDPNPHDGDCAYYDIVTKHNVSPFPQYWIEGTPRFDVVDDLDVDDILSRNWDIVSLMEIDRCSCD